MVVVCVVKETGWTKTDKYSYDREPESDQQLERGIQRNVRKKPVKEILKGKSVESSVEEEESPLREADTKCNFAEYRLCVRGRKRECESCPRLLLSVKQRESLRRTT